MGLLRRRLLLLVVVVTTCVPASQGLRCIQCESNQDCLVEECALGQDLCRTTVLREWEGARGRPFPRGRYLECASCTSLDQSCERGREQSLQCRYPTEHCIEVVTLQSTERKLPAAGSPLGCP
ncbi:rCG53812, isoform CRA_a [Rattus norvegicus]|uniref:RCG53812, isoform CRA_a n=1 Tax=Rattus norvegicus TaxID=10116 RepID=A6J8Z1_RAT|nr:rCG53812, isoform CRA_a [Rattus norvegicus]